MSRDELERIQWGPEPGQPIGGMGTVRILARAPKRAEDVLQRAREVLEIVAAGELSPEAGHWRQVLPEWFVSACLPDPTAGEIKLLRSKSLEERERLRQGKWYLGAFIEWFEPENRYWYWWDSAVLDDSNFVVALEVHEWPFPWDALKWLLMAAGATDVQSEP